MVLEIAHEKSSQLGYWKVEKIIKRRFTWPLLSVDVSKYCTSCESCQKVNKSGLRCVPGIERPIITEILEKISVDIVGPLPKRKGGAEIILTIMCFASCWHEAVHLRTITVFSRIGLPLDMLSDQGSQFNGKLAKEVFSYIVTNKASSYYSIPHSDERSDREITWYYRRDYRQSHC